MLSSSQKLIVAVSMALDIAYHHAGKPLQSASIARRHAMPRRYAEQTLRRLVQGKVLSSGSGPRGGYCLAREPRAITIKDIVEVMESDRVDDSGSSALSQAVVIPLWKELEVMNATKLDQITLEDLCRHARVAGVPRDDTGMDYVI